MTVNKRMPKGWLVLFFMMIVLSGYLYGQRDPSSIGKKSGTDITEGTGSAVFAGGCFWCVEADFEKIVGVIDAVSGYAGGTVKDPNYHEVTSGKTDHAESVKVIYDPSIVTYEDLLYFYFKHVDPTDPDGQFVDRGKHYRPIVFYGTIEEKALAEKVKAKMNESRIFSTPVVTEIKELDGFYPAEEYHQNYCRKNPEAYDRYRRGSGRDLFFEKIWGREYKGQRNKTMSMEDNIEGRSSESSGKREKKYTKPGEEVLKRNLTSIQFKVTQKNGTEPAFDNAYWNHHEEGIYVDIVSGEPLFSSKDKFDSGSGWPSFTRPLASENVVEKIDRSFFMTRIEVRSRHGDSHLGHLFDDGPKPEGKRYCINSSALRFIGKNALSQNGYQDFLYLFDEKNDRTGHSFTSGSVQFGK